MKNIVHISIIARRKERTPENMPNASGTKAILVLSEMSPKATPPCAMAMIPRP